MEQKPGVWSWEVGRATGKRDKQQAGPLIRAWDASGRTLVLSSELVKIPGRGLIMVMIE